MTRDRDDDRGRGRDDDRGRGRDDDRGRDRDRDDSRSARGRDDDRGRGRDDDRGGSRGGSRDEGGGRSQYVYKRRSEKDIKAHGERTGFGDPFLIGDYKMFRPGDGESQFRVLPPTYKDHNHYGFKVFTHGFIGANPSTYLCSEKMNTGKPCPVCAEMRYMKGNGATKEEYSDFSPREAYLMYVVDRDEKHKEPQVYLASWSQDRAIWEQTQSERTGETLYIDDLDAGYDIICKKSGKGKTGTKYLFSIARNSSPLMKSQKDQDDMMYYAEQHPFDERLKFFDAEHIERNMSGSGKSRDEGDDDRGGSRRDKGDRNDRDADDRGRGRDRDDRGGDRERNDDERPRSRSRLDDDDGAGDRERDDDRGRDRDDTRRGADRDRGDARGADRERDDDRGRDRDDGGRGDRDADRGRSRDEDPGRDRGRDRDRDDDRGRGADTERGGRARY